MGVCPEVRTWLWGGGGAFKGMTMSNSYPWGIGGSSLTFSLPRGQQVPNRGISQHVRKGTGIQNSVPIVQRRITGPRHDGFLAKLGTVLILAMISTPAPPHHLWPRSHLPSRASVATGEPATNGQVPSRTTCNSCVIRVGRGLPGLFCKTPKNKSPLGPGIPQGLK